MPSTLPAGSRNHANTSDAFGSIRRTICMPPTHTDEGLRAAIALRRQHPDVGVLMFSQYVETRYATQLLAKSSAGVGYLLKDRVADVGDFIEALKRVAAGGTALDPEVVTQLLGASRQAAALDASLTRRESEVLALIRGALQHSDRRCARHRRGSRREARGEHLRKAGSAGLRQRQPSGTGRSALPGVGTGPIDPAQHLRSNASAVTAVGVAQSVAALVRLPHDPNPRIRRWAGRETAPVARLGRGRFTALGSRGEGVPSQDGGSGRL